jgi:hypothetical protein
MSFVLPSWINEHCAFYTFLKNQLDSESSSLHESTLADWLHTLDPLVKSVSVTDVQRWHISVSVLCLTLCRHQREREFSLCMIPLQTYDNFIPFDPMAWDVLSVPKIDQYFFEALFSWDWNLSELFEVPLLFRNIINCDETRFLLAHVRDAMGMTQQGVTESLLLLLLLELTPVTASLCKLCISYVWDIRALWIEWNALIDLCNLQKRKRLNLT